MKERSPRTIIIHLTFWIGYLFLLVNVLSFRIEYATALRLATVIIIPQAGLAYLNMELLIPRYLIEKKYVIYISSMLVMIAAMGTYLYHIIPELTNEFPFAPPPGFRERFGRFPGPDAPWFTPRRGAVVFNTVQTVGVLLLSSAFKTSQIALKKGKEAAVLKSEKLDSELKFLKSQVNPHFLFNSLNNLYALAVTESPKTPDIILKLSDILRYMIYDGRADKVELKKEVEYLKNYIELFKLKDENIQNIKYHFDEVPEALMIEPMLFIPFVENSFKHSKIEDLEQGWISIDLKLQGRQINFKVENSIPKTSHTKDAVGGIGLENVRRRLSLLYPDRHELKIEEVNDQFSINLTLLL